MLKSLFSKQRIEKMGSYKREYDVYSEEGEPEESDVVADVLSWLKDQPSLEESSTQGNRKESMKEWMTAGLAYEEGGAQAVVTGLQRSIHQKVLIDRSADLLEDLYYTSADIAAGKRMKSSLTVTASIGIGAIVGFVIGTIVFPVIGSAIGGAVGASIATGLAILGHGVGFSILGGAFGSWVGGKIAGKIFKNEKRYELSTKVTKNITSKIGLTSDVSTMINSYLYNRGKTISSPICKQYYKLLRRSIINEANPLALDMTINFFCRELELLNKELDPKYPKPDLKKEIRTVKFILNSLAKAAQTTPRSSRKIRNALKGIKTKSSIKKHIKKEEEILPALDTGVKKRFIDQLHKPKYGITNVQSVEENDFGSNSITHRYKIQHQSGEPLPDVVFSKKELADKLPVAEVMVDKSMVTEQNKKLVSQVLTEQVKAYCEKAPKSRLTIVAAGDDALAIQLLKVAWKAGLEAELDDEEYPHDNKEMVARREHIIEQAKAALKKSRAHTPKVGFKVKTNN